MCSSLSWCSFIRSALDGFAAEIRDSRERLTPAQRSRLELVADGLELVGEGLEPRPNPADIDVEILVDIEIEVIEIERSGGSRRDVT